MMSFLPSEIEHMISVQVNEKLGHLSEEFQNSKHSFSAEVEKYGGRLNINGSPRETYNNSFSTQKLFAILTKCCGP
jgi:hypothetical protein